MEWLPARVAAVLLCILIGGGTPGWGQMGCYRSAIDPRYLRYRDDPELIALAIHTESISRETTSSGYTRTRRILQSLRGAGRSKTLDGAQLAKVIRSPSFMETAYAHEILEFLGTDAPFNRPAELRVTTATLQALSPSCADASEHLAEALGLLFRGRPSPLITFEEGCPVYAALAFRDALQKQGLHAAVGIVTALPPDPSVSGLDYAIVDPMKFPLLYQDQAAVSYARSFLNEQPIIFEIVEPQFYPECFWLATGLAGLRYRQPVRATGDLSEEEVGRLRGVCVLIDSIRGCPMVLSPAGEGNAAPFAFRAPKFPLRLSLLPPVTTFEWVFELPSGVYNIYPFHYDAVADVFVEEGPRFKQQMHAEFSYNLSPPTLGFFGCVLIPSAEDRQTTMGPITPLDGEIPDEDFPQAQ